MNEKLLKYLIYIAGILCLYAFIAVRVLPMFNFALTENRHPDYFEFTKYGELYYFSGISHFKEDLPFPKNKYRLSEENAPIEDAKIIAFGDSFFDINRQKTVAERLHDTLHTEVNAINAWYPLGYLHNLNYKKDGEKIIIFEVVERNIHYRFEKPHSPTLTLNPVNKPTGISRYTHALKKAVFPENDEELYSVMLKESYLTQFFYTEIATLKFDAFGYISSRTPVYDLRHFKSPMLFYDLTVNDNYTSFYFEHTDEMIKNYVDNIEDLASKLKSQYNLDMIFLPIPNKYTMYYKKINPEDTYDDFLPRLYREMDKRNIDYVNIYDDFKKSNKQLYYGTDTHWNKYGVNIAVKSLLEHLSENSSKYENVGLPLSNKNEIKFTNQ